MRLRPSSDERPQLSVPPPSSGQRLRRELFRDRLPLVRLCDEPLARRLRVAAAFRADAERADFGRDADARPPARPPFLVGALFVLRPRPEPDFLPPPLIAFSVAQARRSASFRDTPRSSYPSSMCRA